MSVSDSLRCSLQSENVAGQRSACNSWKNKVSRLTKKVAEQSTKRIAGREPLALLICSSTTVWKRSFATLYADRYSWFTISDVATRRRQTVGTYSIDFYYFAGHAINYRWKYLKKRKKQQKSFESEQWPQTSRVKPVLRKQFQLFFDACCHASGKSLVLHRWQQTSPSRLRGASRPEKADTL